MTRTMACFSLIRDRSPASSNIASRRRRSRLIKAPAWGASGVKGEGSMSRGE